MCSEFSLSVFLLRCQIALNLVKSIYSTAMYFSSHFFLIKMSKDTNIVFSVILQDNSGIGKIPPPPFHLKKKKKIKSKPTAHLQQAEVNIRHQSL